MVFFWYQLKYHDFKRAFPKGSPTVTNYITSPFTFSLPPTPTPWSFHNL